MGCYLNPRDEEKEVFLGREGIRIPDALWPSGDMYLVCLVDNGPFTAAGICYNRLEMDRFLMDRSGRARTWYWVPKEKVRGILGPDERAYLERKS